MFDFANMEWWEILANIILLLNTVTMLLAPMWRKKGHVCLTFCIANAIFVVAFSLLGAWSGVAFSAFFSLVSILNYFFGRLEKKVPLYLVGLLIASAVGLFLLFFFLNIANQWYDAMPLLGAFAIIGMIPFKNMLIIRSLVLANNLAWLTYAIGISSVGNLVQNIILSVTAAGAIVWYHAVPKWRKQPEKSAVQTEEASKTEKMEKE